MGNEEWRKSLFHFRHFLLRSAMQPGNHQTFSFSFILLRKEKVLGSFFFLFLFSPSRRNFWKTFSCQTQKTIFTHPQTSFARFPLVWSGKKEKWKKVFGVTVAWCERANIAQPPYLWHGSVEREKKSHEVFFHNLSQLYFFFLAIQRGNKRRNGKSYGRMFSMSVGRETTPNDSIIPVSFITSSAYEYCYKEWKKFNGISGKCEDTWRNSHHECFYGWF